MSHHERELRLRHMQEHANEAVAMTGGRTRAQLDSDRQLNLSLVRLLEIVDEAAGRVPAEERARLADIPWPEIVGLRNRLIHAYDSVDFDCPVANHQRRFAATYHGALKRLSTDKEACWP